MQSKKIALRALITAIVLLPLGAAAQSSSINAFSPYTFYGFGDIANQGTTLLRSMGGAGVAYVAPARINYLNPAAMSAGPRNSFMINLGLEGENYYLKNEAGQKTSFNSFNIRDIALQFPLASGLSFGASVTPFSSVGYRVQQVETDPDILADLGRVTYDYEGEGGITQVKAGMGLRLYRWLSVGAEMVYYQGRIERSFDINITPVTATGRQSSIYSYVREDVSKVYANMGIQVSPLMSDKRMLTLGATYQPGGALDARVERLVPSGSVWSDTVSFSSHLTDFRMPGMLTVGMSYQTPKLSVNADYSYQNWGRNNGSDLEARMITYRNTNSFKFGGEYTPNRLDVRRFMNRLTYRAGFRYNDYYMQVNGQDVTDKAVTFGVGIPLKMAGLSNINVGLEIGSRGSTKQNLIKENYFKISIGLGLFGEDDWFVKRKYY